MLVQREAARPQGREHELRGGLAGAEGRAAVAAASPPGGAGPGRRAPSEEAVGVHRHGGATVVLQAQEDVVRDAVAHLQR